MASILEYISEEDYARYNDILGQVEEAYKNRPKERKARGPMTYEQKVKMAQGRKEKAEALLAKLLADEGVQ